MWFNKKKSHTAIKYEWSRQLSWHSALYMHICFLCLNITATGFNFGPCSTFWAVSLKIHTIALLSLQCAVKHEGALLVFEGLCYSSTTNTLPVQAILNRVIQYVHADFTTLMTFSQLLFHFFKWFFSSEYIKNVFAIKCMNMVLAASHSKVDLNWVKENYSEKRKWFSRGWAGARESLGWGVRLLEAG